MGIPPGHNIVISPIGELEPDLIETVCGEVHLIFNFDVEVISLLNDVEFAFDADRNQYYSTPILTQLAKLAPPSALKVLALTRVDLFIPILTHVYGEAQLGGKACLISTARLDESLTPAHANRLYLDRVSKEAAHELAHTFNLRHCKDAGCLMHYCRSIRDVDQKNNDFCRYCRTLLGDELKRMGLGD